jgi:hypothetical protein
VVLRSEVDPSFFFSRDETFRGLLIVMIHVE